MYWLNVDKPERTCTLHHESCNRRPRGETNYKGFGRLKRDGGWFAFPTTGESRGSFRRNWETRDFELKDCSYCKSSRAQKRNAQKHARLTANQIRTLKDRFLGFLGDVSLRSDFARKPKRSPDDLFHANLIVFASGEIAIEEPNRHGAYSSGKHRFLSLQWGDDALLEAVFEATKLCQNVSESLTMRLLRQLMIRIFEEQAVSGKSDAHEGESTGNQQGGEIDSILEILDITQVDAQLIGTIEWLQDQAIPRTFYVLVDGIKVGNGMTVGDVVLRSRIKNGELRLPIPASEPEDARVPPSAGGKAEYEPCYAKLTNVGDEEFARMKAVHRVRQALDIANFSLSSTFHQPSWAKVRILDVFSETTSLSRDPIEDRAVTEYSYSKGRPFDFTRHGVKRALQPLYREILKAESADKRDWRLEQERLEQIIDRLLACYQATGQIATRVQRAVTWYSKAVDAETLDEQFVNLSIALESLLIGDEGRGQYATTGSISQNLGERTAFLLRGDFESRNELLKHTKYLYGLRSGIVHHGKSIASAQLKEMDDLVKRATVAFVRHDFQSWSDFQEWIARQKFSQKRVQSPEVEGRSETA